MRRLFPTACLTLAWLCAHGAIWDVVQVLAWTKMFAGYAQTLPLPQALRETFDPAKPCEMCVSVSKAKEQERAQPLPATDGSRDKLVLALHSTAPVVFSRPVVDWPDVLVQHPAPRSERVPVPPPRA